MSTDNALVTVANHTSINNHSDLDLDITPPSTKWGLLGLIIVIVCTAVGNLLVCLAVCWDRRLQNMTNYFLMSLAIADLLVALVVMPFGMVVEIYGYFPLPSELCTLWITMDVLMCTASIWHMCTMSMDRYFTLKYPMQYGRNKTKTMVALKILFVWVVSMAISSPICIYGLVDESSVYTPDKMCLITLPTFMVVGSIFAFYIPLCIMILSYLLTVQILKKNQKLMKTIDRSDFKMRQKYGGFSRNCHVTTLVSPPSSDSRRESHTDVSSLARTPNRERVNLPGAEHELQALELRNILDNAYVNSHCTNLSNGVNSGNKNYQNNHNNNSELDPHTQSLESPNDNETNRDISNTCVTTYTFDKTEETSLLLDDLTSDKNYDRTDASSLIIDNVNTGNSYDITEASSLLIDDVNNDNVDVIAKPFNSSLIKAGVKRFDNNTEDNHYNRTEASSLIIDNVNTENYHDKTDASSPLSDDVNITSPVTSNYIAPITTVNIQGPSEDEADEFSSLLNNDGLSRSNSMSPSLPRFRLRTNTDVTSSNFPNSHSSLKIPKHHEKQNLQASVSCSNFSQNKDSAETLFKSIGLANRDYKSLEWCHHFYEIQEEMDECLRETRLEKKLERERRIQALKDSAPVAVKPVENKSEINSTCNQSSDIQKDELKPANYSFKDLSESGDSMDDIDTSSDNVSDTVTIKLYPQSVYMYKLNVPKKSSATSDPADRLSSDVRIKRGSFPRGNSLDSDKSVEISHKIQKRSSIRKFLTHCKTKNFISSKSTTNEKKASKVLGIIFAVFVILWTPFFMANFIIGVCEPCRPYFSPVLMSSLVWMGYMASLANPIIYTMFNTAFRRTFKKILKCDICRQSKRTLRRSSAPSYAASVYNDRRQTLTVLVNGTLRHGNESASMYNSTSYGR